MDIWAWVEEFTDKLEQDGQQRLAHDILLLPQLVVDNRHDEVDRLVPSLLGAARQIESRWLEIYVRHWNLQSRVLHRYEVKGLLPEAVDLLDFANQDDTKTCPQSICVVQDLAQCYTNADGPAYGQERLDVARETLDRIDPTWPCFRCISSEYASALLDLDRPQEALDFCYRQLAAIGPSADPQEFRESKVEALLALGRLEEALAFNTDAENPEGGESWLVHKAIDQARLLTRLGRHEEALEALPTFEAIIDTPAFFVDWVDAVDHIVRGGHRANDWELDLGLRVMALRLEENGALRDAWRVHHRRCALSLSRGRPWVARHAVEDMRRVADQLERPLDAPLRTDEAEREVAEAEATAEVAVYETPEANLENASSEPDLEYERMRRALEKWPNDQRLWLGWSRTAGMLGRAEEIVESGRAFVGPNPGAWQVAIVVGQTMVALGDLDDAEAWSEATFDRIDNNDSKASARFVQALTAEARGDREQMQARLEQVITFDPKARNSRSMLARIARDRGDYDVALEHLEVLIEIEPDVPPHHWDRIVAATLEDRWDLVRESSAALGMTIRSEEGPIEENWGICRIQFRDDTGSAFELHAVRTGPVTARIIEISDPALDTQYYGASVVFDPRPTNPPEPEAQTNRDAQEDDDEDVEQPPLIFPVLDTLYASAYTAFVVDGMKPSDVHFDALRADFAALNAVIQVRSGADYRIEHAALGARDAAYWYVAVPEDADLGRLAERLETLEAALDGPLVWPQLAAYLGQNDRLQAQEVVISEWSLM